MHRKTKAKVYINRLKENLKYLRSQSHCKKLCMMVKANAYGHGSPETCLYVEDAVDAFGVISIEEAEVLRQAGLKKEIWLFSNLWEESISDLERLNLVPVIGDFASLQAFLNHSERLAFHIKINTGMNRFGFKKEQLQDLIDLLKEKKRYPSALATHMLDGNQFQAEKGACAEQLQYFKECLTYFDQDKVFYHLYKSAPALLNEEELVEEAYMEWIRPGIACYGVLPDKEFPKNMSLQPVMELTSVLVAIQEVKKGESVSYGANWIAKEDSSIGVVQIGYADGIPRILSNRVHFLVAGERVPQVGNICMDYCMLDLTKVRAKVAIGDEVVVFGSQGDKINAVEDLATIASTIPYEILTSVAARVRRQYILDET